MTTSSDEVFEQMPHVDREWAGQAITELALRDVSGANIGAAMAEVESHMAEHGGDVRDVFGDPKAYAAELQLPDTEKLSGMQWAGVWLPAILLYTGLSVLLNGVVAVFGGAGLSVVAVGIVLVFLNLAAVAIVRFDLLRFMVAHPVISVVVLTVLTGTLGVLAALAPGPTLDLAPTISIPAGGLVMAAGIALLFRISRRARANGITFPSA